MIDGIWKMISGFFGGIFQIFNIVSYIKQFGSYKSDFTALDWILAIFSFILVMAVSCSTLDIHPYDCDIKGERDINARNIAKIEEYTNAKKEFTFAFISDTQRWYDETEDVVKSINGKPVRVSDVADVVIGSAIKMGYASSNAERAVILSVSKQPNINTLNVTKNIEKNLEDIKKSLPKDVVMDTKIFRQADFIEASVSNVGSALIEGAIFVIVILFLFLGSFRTTLISIIAIPLSLLGTVIVLHLLGMNINTMTLGGMCIAIGSLVDDAIVDVENVYKRLRENHRLPKGERKSAFNVVFEASSEIRSSIVNATFIIIVTFIPLFFLTGMEGRMLKPLGIAYIVSLFMSLIVAMTITPLLCKMLL